MSNILPEEFRSRLRITQTSRIVALAALLSIVIAALVFASCVPAYIMLRMSETRLHTASNTMPAATSSDAATLARAQAILDVVAAFASATTSPSDSVNEALRARPEGIHITSISYQPGAIVLSGAADNHTVIDQYRSALASDPLFSKVDIPVGALVGTGGTAFTINLSGSF